MYFGDSSVLKQYKVDTRRYTDIKLIFRINLLGIKTYKHI